MFSQRVLQVHAGVITFIYIFCSATVVASRPQYLGSVTDGARVDMRALLAAAEETSAEPASQLLGGISPVGMAFLLVVIAGLCAPLGACVVLFINTEKHVRMLPGGLALAAGVMIMVSIYEVLHESLHHFEIVLENAALVQLCTMASFFLGVPVCSVLDWITDRALNMLLRKERRKDHSHPSRLPSAAVDRSESNDVAVTARGPVKHSASNVSNSSLPATLNNKAIEASCPSVSGAVACLTSCAGDNYRALIRTSILVTLALELHNIPEGLATFVGFMSAPTTGILIAVAIAMHNIPEGICVAIPVYFATGKKWKGILWAAIAGVTEPIGALIGFGVYQTGHMNDVAMGVIMGLVAGIMTSVSFNELLPRALSYDRTGRVTYYGVMTGMLFMAVSLVLLALWD